jgi:hypothetical protein
MKLVTNDLLQLEMLNIFGKKININDPYGDMFLNWKIHKLNIYQLRNIKYLIVWASFSIIIKMALNLRIH